MVIFVAIEKDLFEKWLEMANPVSTKLLAYLCEKSVPLSESFLFVTKAILGDDNSQSTFSSKQLVEFLEKQDIISKLNNGDNQEILQYITKSTAWPSLIMYESKSS